MDATRVTQDESIVDELLRHAEFLFSRRGIWEAQWEAISQKVLPYYSTTFFSQGNTAPGTQRNQEQFDVTANGALLKFASIMESELVPMGSPWHRIRPVDPILKKSAEAMRWYDLVGDTMFHYRYSPRSGFHANMHEGFVSIGAFGTCGLFTDAYKDPTDPGAKGLRYRQIPLGELFFSCNHQGQVDTVFRRFKMTLRQLAQRWGQESLPEQLKEKLAVKPEEEVFVVHCVRPNSQFEPGRIDAKGKRFSSHYILKDQRHLMEVGGYRCFPYSVARYITAPGELYGRGPAMNVFPSINVLNEEKKVVLKSGHRALDPVLLAYDDGILDGFQMRNGALNYGGVSADGRPLVHALPMGDMRIGQEIMEDERKAINSGFLIDLFQILVETPQMTATEVLERAREKGALISPTMGRFQSEGLGPMIEREFDLLVYQGLIPPPPQIILDANAEYKIEYDAPLNRQMRAEAASGIMRSVQYSAEIASQTQDPSVMDWYDFDTITPEVADINGAPFRFIRSPEQVAQIRQGRQMDKEAAQLTQALPGMAAMTKAVSPQGVMQTPGQPG